MVFNFIFFTVRIERHTLSAQSRLNRYRQEQWLQEMAESRDLQAIQHGYLNRI